MPSLVIGLAAIVSGCGGGSDDDPAPTSSTTPNFGGIYTVTFTKTQDSCGTTAAATIAGEDLVIQSGRNITITSATFTFTGTVDTDNGGFTVGNTTVNGNVTGQSSVTFRLRPATSDYLERLTVVTSVAGNPTPCTVVYEGIATRR